MKIAYTIMVLAAAFVAQAETKFSAVSPDRLNEVRLEVGDKGMSYSVWRRGKVLVKPSSVALNTQEHGHLDGKGVVPSATKRKLEGIVKTPIYKKSQVDLAANETRVDFGEWAVVLVARDDGVAWRFETKSGGELTVVNEDTQYFIPEDATLCYSRVGGFQTGFEQVASYGKPGEVPTGHHDIVLAPMTAVVPDAGVVGMTESNLLDYPGLNFRHTKDEAFLRAAFASEPDPEKVKVGKRMTSVKGRLPYLAKTTGSRVFPWRVYVLADNPSGLVSSDVVYALAEPSRIADTSWIKVGLVQWDWWHGFNISDVPGLKTGCNFETYKAYIDFAAANGIPYIIMDEGWSEKLNLDKPRAEANPEGVIKYGQEKGVDVILWAAWAPLMKAEDRARIFDRYAAMGAKGFKIDFMQRDDRVLEKFLEDTAADAAARKLVVMYHGIHKPTGLCRTFPNVINYEGVYGLEQGHGRGGQQKIPPNDCAIPYMRGLAGMMDYTPGAMHNRASAAPEFRSVDKNEPRGCYGTRCHQLALFPIFEGPVQMLCDSPTMYRKNKECTDFLVKIPTVWDETVGVAGEIGKFSSIARRKGSDWWLGAITDWEKRELELPTKFLGEGEWKVEAFEDADDADVNAEHYVRREFTVKAGDSIKVRLAPGGGFAARFSPYFLGDCPCETLDFSAFHGVCPQNLGTKYVNL